MQSTVLSEHSRDGHADQRAEGLPSVAGFGAVNSAVSAHWLFHTLVGRRLIWTRFCFLTQRSGAKFVER
jgi:hypothetical protein